MSIDFAKIKIVIWDLDETFWTGTLSEGAVTLVPENIELVKSLSDIGIVNSICSKNDLEPTKNKLQEIGIWDYFVFPSIDWNSKGSRLKSTLKNMGLRPQNCLFIDDNIQNLKEASYHCDGIMTAEPNVIKDLILYVKSKEISDPTHKRLNQYQILEQKVSASKKFDSNEEFLFSSDIRVEIHRDCINQLDRIAELVHRSNQLNFTKNRATREELENLIRDASCDSGYVTVKDRFGDYGMVGFFAIKNNHCVHFLFSCRTIGQGVEEYVYAQLGYPILNVVEPVVNHLTNVVAPPWINQSNNNLNIIVENKKSSCKIIFKGGCDLAQMSEYLDSDEIITEFTYMGKDRNNNIEHHNHSTNYLQWHSLDKSNRKRLVTDLVFNDADMFETSMFDPDVKLVILSTMVEPNLGIYRNKNTGFEIAFGESSHPLTAKEQQKLYLEGSIYDADNNFSQKWFNSFTEEYEFIGALTPEQILENAKKTLKMISPFAKLAYILGPELKFEDEPLEHYYGRERTYKAINNLFRQWASEESRVLLIDSNNWVKKQGDFTNNINHWNRQVYFNMAQLVNSYIRDISNKKVKTKGKCYLLWRMLADKVGKTGLYETGFWLKIHKLTH